MTTPATIFAKLVLDSQDYTKGLNKSKTDTKAFTKDGQSSLGGLGTAFEKVTGFSLGMAGAVGIAAVAVQKTVKFLKECEQAANESNIVMAKQEAILKATGYAAGLTSEQLREMADVSSKLTGIDDELIANSQSVLLTFRNIGANEFPRAQQAALDLQTTFGDLNTSSMMLGKALNDPVKGVTALGKAGVTFSEEQKKQIKYFAETNQLAKAQAIILSEVERQVGGTAEAMEKASDGSNRLKVSSENLKETIGSLLIPVTRTWNDAQSDVNDRINTAIKLQTGEIDKANYLHKAYLQRVKDVGVVTTSYEEYIVAAVKKANTDGTYADWMLSTGNRASLTQLENGKDLTELNWLQQASILQLISRVNGLTEAQYRLAGATSTYSIEQENAFAGIGDFWNIIGTEAELSAEQIEAAADAMTAFGKSQLSITDSVMSSETKFNDTYKKLMEERVKLEQDKTNASGEALDEINSDLAKNTLALQDNAEEYELAKNKILLGYTEQLLAADGLTQEEVNFLLKKGQEWGIYSDTAVAEMQAIMEEAALLTGSINSIPNAKTLTITTIYESLTRGGTSSTTAQQIAKGVAAGNVAPRAYGGTTIAGSTSMVNERGVPEIVSVGNKDYLTMGSQNGTVTPLSSADNSSYSGMSRSDLDALIIAATPNYGLIGMQIKNALIGLSR